MAIAVGATIGNYRVLSKIGTGGMGAVYLAEHPLIGKKVALKVIHQELANNREVVQRFFQEAQAVNKIGNEHIVEIHDVGVTPEGDHYYIMEYLEGRTLASVLTSDRVMDVMRALHVGGQIASALAAAHNSGVIHRDLKPDNIMLVQRGAHHDFVKVLDFGLAKMFQAGMSAVKTAAGVLLGTPQYMSPEACESRRDVDHRTDIYALGILLFQMMCGRLPFDGDSMGEVLIKQITALPPAPRGINPAIPPSVEQVLLRSLAKQPDQRFPNMSAFRDALLDPERYLGASPPMAPARSVAPGEATVDARHVIAAAHAAAATRAAAAQPAFAPARPVAAVSGAQRTMIVGAHLAPGQIPPGIPPGSAQAPLPNMPQQPKMNTMRINTPVGYSARPPRKVWPIVLALGAAIGLGVGVFMVVYVDGAKKQASGRGSATTLTVTPAATLNDAAIDTTANAVAAVAPPDAAVVAPPDAAVVAPPDAAVVAPPDATVVAMARIEVTLESVPDGATVFDGTKALGKTPLRLDWPVDQASPQLTFRKSGFVSVTKTFTVEDKKNVALKVEMARKKEKAIGPAGRPDTGLERPF